MLKRYKPLIINKYQGDGEPPYNNGGRPTPIKYLLRKLKLTYLVFFGT